MFGKIPDTATIAAFRRVRTAWRAAGALVLAGVGCIALNGFLGVVAIGAVVFGWHGVSLFPIAATVGVSVGVVIGGVRLGVHADERHRALLQQSLRPEDIDWLVEWIDRAPSVAAWIATWEAGQAPVGATLHTAWRLACADGETDPASLEGTETDAADRTRRIAHEQLRLAAS